MTEAEMLAYWQEQMPGAPVARCLDRIPEHMRGGVLRYVVAGIPPGSFLTAVLANDFLQAVRHADDANRAALADYAMLIFKAMPGSSIGSREAVSDWIRDGGFFGEVRRMTESDVPTPAELAANATMHDAALAVAGAQNAIAAEARSTTGPIDLLLWERLRAAHLQAEAAIVGKHIAETEAKRHRNETAR